MLSRRLFIAGSIGVLFAPQLALAKKNSSFSKQADDPRVLVKEQWPPSMTPDFVYALDAKGTLIADRSGRIAVVDCKQQSGPSVLHSQILRRKIVDMSFEEKRAWLLASEEAGSEQHYYLQLVSMQPSAKPAVDMPVDYLAEPAVICAWRGVVAVAGTTGDGANQVVLVNANIKDSREADVPLAKLPLAQPPLAMRYQDKQLLVLESGPDSSILEIFAAGNARAPQKMHSVALGGSFDMLTGLHDIAVATSSGGGRHRDLRVIALHPKPRIVATQRLPLSDVFDATMQRGQILALGNQGNKLVIAPIAIEKNYELTLGSPVALPADCHGSSRARLAIRDKDACVATDNGSIAVLAAADAGWHCILSHNVPRLPVSSVLLTGDKAILAGADLKVYDLTSPATPRLAESTPTAGVVRGMAAAGDALMVLTHDSLTLRKLDKPAKVVASVPVVAGKVAYDPAQRTAYVIAPAGKKTKITAMSLQSGLTAQTPRQVDGAFEKIVAADGKLIVAGLHDIAALDGDGNVLSARKFPNFAIRDVALAGDAVIVSALDANSHGALLVLDAKQLNTTGAVDLPHDGVALACKDALVVAVGSKPDGKDAVALIDISSPASPKVKAIIDTIESASAVAIDKQYALVGGRGLSLIRLS